MVSYYLKSFLKVFLLSKASFLSSKSWLGWCLFIFKKGRLDFKQVA